MYNTITNPPKRGFSIYEGGFIMSGTDVGQVLGASTAMVAGVAVLPNTGGNTLVSAFALLAIVLGGVVLTSFVSTRIIKKVIR